MTVSNVSFVVPSTLTLFIIHSFHSLIIKNFAPPLSSIIIRLVKWSKSYLGQINYDAVEKVVVNYALSATLNGS